MFDMLQEIHNAIMEILLDHLRLTEDDLKVIDFKQYCKYRAKKSSKQKKCKTGLL